MLVQPNHQSEQKLFKNIILYGNCVFELLTQVKMLIMNKEYFINFPQPSIFLSQLILMNYSTLKIIYSNKKILLYTI